MSPATLLPAGAVPGRRYRWGTGGRGRGLFVPDRVAAPGAVDGQDVKRGLGEVVAIVDEVAVLGEGVSRLHSP